MTCTNFYVGSNGYWLELVLAMVTKSTVHMYIWKLDSYTYEKRARRSGGILKIRSSIPSHTFDDFTMYGKTKQR